MPSFFKPPSPITQRSLTATNPNVKIDMGVNLKMLSVSVLLCVGSMGFTQTNRYLTELGKSHKVKTLNDWSKENDGIRLSDSEDEQYYGVALPEYGVIYDHHFNKVNKITTVTRITFGKASNLKLMVTLDDEERFRDARQDLPFGLKIGMSRGEVESKTGKLRTTRHSQKESVQQVFFSNLPGYRFLDLTMWFENEELSLFVIATDRNGANSYQRRLEEVDHPMKMDIKSAISEKTKTNSKIPYGSFFGSIDFVLNGDNGVPMNDMKTEEIIELLNYELGADSVIHISNQGYRAVWCTSDIVDKESLFDEYRFYMSIALDSGFRNNGYKDRFIADYQSSEVSNLDHYYYSPDDRDRYLAKRKKPLFHLYQLAQSNEVVLDVYEPSDTRINQIAPAYVGVCAPENPDMALSDDEYLKKLGIDVQVLNQRFSKDEGNAFLRILGGGESFSAVGFDTGNGYNEKTTENWLKRIEFSFDKEYSRRVFKGSLPFGFKKGMKLSQIENIIPGSEYEKWHEKKDWFTTYSGKRITENIRLSITMSFRKGKLGRLVFEIEEETANSREWKLLKTEIFPELNN